MVPVSGFVLGLRYLSLGIPGNLGFVINSILITLACATVNLDLPSSPATQAEKNVNVMHNNRGGKSRALGQRAET